MRYLTDFAVGQRYQAGPIDVTEQDIIAFARQYDPQPFHLDPETARKSFFRGLAASGWLTASLTMRLLLASGFDVKWGLIGREVESLRWHLPVRPGDSLRAVSEITAVTQPRPGKKHGMIHFSTETINQKDEVAMSMRSSCPVPLRTDGSR